MTDRSSASPKPATGTTKAANSKLLQELPFGDIQDFEDAKSGFIAPLPNNGVVTNAMGELNRPGISEAPTSEKVEP